MQSILTHKAFAFAALLIWLLASWSGAHGHLCFDGQEPPVSVHMHAPDIHSDHDSDKNHLDANVDVEQFAPAKSVKLDLPFLLVTACLLVLFSAAPTQVRVIYSRQLPSPRASLRPPLRAPPVIPA